MKALNKAFSKADPQQASCILSYILEKKNLSAEDKNKFSIMKCNILFGLGALFVGQWTVGQIWVF